ncbi:MAG: AAA family ATPase [Mucilaginibacter polytrichastri]|nr:AAA family ATPase [Mucilaginibacter polytrichastri]
MEFIALFRSLIKRKWVLIIACGIAGAAAFLSTMKMRKGYLSKAQITAGFNSRDITGNSQRIQSETEADVQFSNLTEMIGSPQVYAFTGYQLLKHDFHSASSFKKFEKLSEDDVRLMDEVSKQKLNELLDKKLATQTMLTPNDPFERKVIDLMELYGYDQDGLGNVVMIARVAVSDYVNITATTENAELSAFIVNGMADNFLKYNRSLQSAQSGSSLDTLKKYRQAKFAAFNAKQQELTNYKSQHGILDMQSSGDSKVRQSSNFEEELAAQQKKLALDRAELAEARRQFSALGKKKYVSADVLDIRDKINDLQQRYQTSKDPALQRQIDELTKKREDLIANSDLELTTNDRATYEKYRDRIVELTSEIAGLEKSVQYFNEQINKLNSNLTTYAGQEANLRKLEQEVELAKNEYTLSDENLNKAQGLSSSYLAGSMRQTLIGQPALKPEKSMRKYIIVGAVFATLFLCVLIIVLLEYIDQSIRTPANFSRLTGAKLLGSVPEINWLKKTGSFLYSPEMLNENKAIRTLINNIRYNLESSGQKVFLITSTKDGDGKTTILSLLSSIYSNTTQDILIIDSNFSHNEITRKMNINTNDGNQFFLDEGATTRALPGSSQLQDVATATNTTTTVAVAPTKYKNVDIIGCKEDYNLSSIKFPNHAPLNRFKQLSDKYDFVFIEGPSLNGYSDSKELAKYVDGIIMVTSAKTPWKYQDKQSLEFLQSMDDRFIGTILNMVDPQDLQ